MSVFQFSIELKGNQNVLKSWLEHFKKTGMPAGLVEHEGYASVWRVGSRSGLGDKIDKPVGLLKMWEHDFEKYWEEAGGKVAGDDVRRIGWNKE